MRVEKRSAQRHPLGRSFLLHGACPKDPRKHFCTGIVWRENYTLCALAVGGMVGCIGMIIAATMYTRTPGTKPVNTTTSVQMRRNTVESIVKYSAVPPHTPVNILSVLLRYNFLVRSIYVHCIYRSTVWQLIRCYSLPKTKKTPFGACVALCWDEFDECIARRVVNHICRDRRGRG